MKFFEIFICFFQTKFVYSYRGVETRFKAQTSQSAEDI